MPHVPVASRADSLLDHRPKWNQHVPTMRPPFFVIENKAKHRRCCACVVIRHKRMSVADIVGRSNKLKNKSKSCEGAFSPNDPRSCDNGFAIMSRFLPSLDAHPPHQTMSSFISSVTSSSIGSNKYDESQCCGGAVGKNHIDNQSIPPETHISMLQRPGNLRNPFPPGPLFPYHPCVPFSYSSSYPNRRAMAWERPHVGLRAGGTGSYYHIGCSRSNRLIVDEISQNRTGYFPVVANRFQTDPMRFNITAPGEFEH